MSNLIDYRYREPSLRAFLSSRLKHFQKLRRFQVQQHSINKNRQEIDKK